MKAGEFPFSVLGNAMEKCTDEATRLQTFRVAIRSWIQRPVPGRGLAMHPCHGCLHLFASKWQLLPRDEAAVLTREIVASILRHPDTTIHAQIGDVQNGAAFTSSQDHELFEILNVLRELIPDVLDSLLKPMINWRPARDVFLWDWSRSKPSRVYPMPSRKGGAMLSPSQVIERNLPRCGPRCKLRLKPILSPIFRKRRASMLRTPRRKVPTPPRVSAGHPHRNFETLCSVPGRATVRKPAHILIASRTLTCVCSPRSSSLPPLLVCRNSQDRAVFFIFRQNHIDTFKN